MPHKHELGSAQDWLSRAQAKLAFAGNPPPGCGYWEDPCFLLQQAAEFAVKGVYQLRGWRFAHVHDLSRLFDGWAEKGLAVPDSVRDAEFISIYAVQMRYPAMTGLASEEDYRRARRAAEGVVAWAEEMITH